MPISFYTYARRNKIKGVQSKHIHNVADFHARLLMLSPHAKIDMFRLYRDLLMDNKINRDTRTEQRLFKRTPDERKKAIYRARNRREFEAAGLVKPGDKLHIHHLDGNAHNNNRRNLRVVDPCAHAKLHGQKCHKRKLK